jgi:protocatechuate 3,4-dioxygenase beta subunit
MIRLWLAICLAAAIIGCSGTAARTAAPGASSPQPATALATPVAQDAPTPSPIACSGVATPAVTEGPYFKAGSPESAALTGPAVAGTSLLVTGHVLNLACAPVVGALLDFWQADGNGQYDNNGYRLRGHQFTDAEGAFRLETVIPGEYPGRTQHIHVKVQAPGGRVLTTQLFFPGSPRNGQDSIFNSALLLKMSSGGSTTALYDFVLSPG